MSERPRISEVSLASAPWQELQQLLESCFPKPPSNVFPLLIAASHTSQRIWLAHDGGILAGIVMLSPYSKGGHLENLAVHPMMRKRGIGRLLVNTLLAQTAKDKPTMISLTTRIPRFFDELGFKACGQLGDGSTAMVSLLYESASCLPVA
jgi:ribosomal protein S18 acetylase RimI-like enzyme